MAEPVRITVEEIRVENFRAFDNARLQLDDLTYLVGPNGAGKSSLLDAVDLLREALTDSLVNALDRRGGLQRTRRLMPADADGDRHMGLAVKMAATFPAGRRSVQLLYGFMLEKLENDGYDVFLEVFSSRPETSVGYVRHLDRIVDSKASGVVPSVLVGALPPAGNLVLPLIAHRDSLWYDVLDCLKRMRAYELSPTLMASAPEIDARSTLMRSGLNAADIVRSLEGTPEHAWIVRRLAAIMPGLVGLESKALLGRRVLRFHQEIAGQTHELDASQVSQGTLRALGVLLALRQMPPASVVLVDEIEASVHPNALAVLLDAAADSVERTRVVLTSHSPEVLGHPSVTGDRVRVVQWRDGVSSIYRLNQPTLEAVNEIDTVGWMLRSNTLWTDEQPERFGRLFDLGPEP